MDYKHLYMQDFNSLLSEIGEFGIVEQVYYPIVVVSGLPGVCRQNLDPQALTTSQQRSVLGGQSVDVVLFECEVLWT